MATSILATIDGALRDSGTTLSAELQARANAKPDEFDLLIREAMFSLLDEKQLSDRQKTFSVGPRGLTGPFKTVLG